MVSNISIDGFRRERVQGKMEHIQQQVQEAQTQLKFQEQTIEQNAKQGLSVQPHLEEVSRLLLAIETKEEEIAVLEAEL